MISRFIGARGLLRKMRLRSNSGPLTNRRRPRPRKRFSSRGPRLRSPKRGISQPGPPQLEDEDDEDGDEGDEGGKVLAK